MEATEIRNQTWSWLHVLLLVLIVSVVATAVSVVNARHKSRVLFAELQKLNRVQDEVETEWGQLQLEQSSWSTHARIEGAASGKLEMHIPQASEIVIIRP
ncbi:MAG TPA: cell division protein FtsL [Gammaproteobacteria bacterium]|nr:cell division protein FtsL [Gammaproteobacteria bacterium]